MPRIDIPRLAKLQNPIQRHFRFLLITFWQSGHYLDVRDIRITGEDNLIRIVAHATPVMSGRIDTSPLVQPQ